MVFYAEFPMVNMSIKILLSDRQIINFIKDHDYVEIVDSSGEVVYSFDPSIYDLTYLDFHD